MAEKRFMIAPFKSGLMQNMPNWELPDDGFTQLNNAYVYRERVRKRIGAKLLGTPEPTEELQHLRSRLRAVVGQTDVNGDANFLLSTSGDWGDYLEGSGFSIGDTYFTVPDLGTPTVMLPYYGNPAINNAVGLFDTTTGELTIQGNGDYPMEDIYFYPSYPVMGLPQYLENQVNDQTTVAFDTRFSYRYTPSGFERIGTVNWTGDDLNFFWSMNYRGISGSTPLLFTTNFNATIDSASTYDPIRYWNGGAAWQDYSPLFYAPNNVPPTFGSSPAVVTSRIMVSWYNRILLFNTMESVDTGAGYLIRPFKNRVRYSAEGNPFATNAWYESQFQDGTQGSIGAGFEDAATQEEIISVGFIKNRLIVYFEESTWELAFTGNAGAPFVWQRLTTELGSHSTFSAVSFDKALLAVGGNGIHAASGTNVQRIDEKIPTAIFRIADKVEGIQRVHGIRDFYDEMVYWTLPSLDDDDALTPFPNRILAYNYINKSWAYFDDTITVFGYKNQSEDFTWGSLNITWEQANFSWGSGLQQANHRAIIAGNHRGFVFYLIPGLPRNSQSMMIAEINLASPQEARIIAPDHNLIAGQAIAIEYADGLANINKNFIVTYPLERDFFTIVTDGNPSNDFVGTYNGNGQITRVSTVSIVTKPWNPYVLQGMNVALNRVQFALEKTDGGAVSANYFVSNTQLSMANASQATGTALGSNEVISSPLTPLEAEMSILWRLYYPFAQGSNIALQLTYDTAQLLDRTKCWSPFELQAISLYFEPTGFPLN